VPYGLQGQGSVQRYCNLWLVHLVSGEPLGCGGADLEGYNGHEGYKVWWLGSVASNSSVHQLVHQRFGELGASPL
jgi:hypothetical protein